MGYQPTSGYDPLASSEAVPAKPADGSPMFATTASMQNLLFEHFAALQNGLEPGEVLFPTEGVPETIIAEASQPTLPPAVEIASSVIPAAAPAPSPAPETVVAFPELAPLAQPQTFAPSAPVLTFTSPEPEPAPLPFQKPTAYADVPELDDDALILAQLTAGAARVVADITEETRRAEAAASTPVMSVRPADQDYINPDSLPPAGAAYAQAPSLKMMPTPVAEQRRAESSAPARSHVTTPAAPRLDPNDPAAWPLPAKILIEDLKAENEKLKAALREEASRALMAESLAETDVLTPTLNRRGFMRELQRAIADCKRYGEKACLIYVDLDGFKQINDTYGHEAGDAALIHVANVLGQNIREGDAVGRLGGDEFALLLRRAELQPSRIKAMMLEAELSVSTFAYKDLYLKVGGSFGVRAFMGQNSPDEWLAEADAAMFLVKKSIR